MRIPSLTLAVVLSAGSVLGLATTAHADPARETLSMTCANGRTLVISPAPANGTFTPTFDAAGTNVYKPLQITVRLTLLGPDGSIESQDERTSTLGQGRQLERSDVVACTVTETLTSADDPEVPAGASLVVNVVMLGVFTPTR